MTMPLPLTRTVYACVLALCAASPLQAQTGPAPASQKPSFLSLFTKLPEDAAHLLTVSNGVALGLGGAAALAVHPKDDEIARRALSWHSLDDALRAGNALGNGGVQAGFGLATYIAGWVVDNQKAAQIGADLLRAQMINALLTSGVKVSVDRTRPDGGSLSFPSGHTSSTFATAAVLHRRLGWKIGVPAYAAASYVGLSRLTDHKHYPSDIVFGAVVGLISGRATTFHQYGGTVHVTPQASARRAGIVVAWTQDAQ
jgi:membrane-associated phospholipid phosphatase